MTTQTDNNDYANKPADNNIIKLVTAQGGCFGGDSSVMIIKNKKEEKIFVKNLKKGDEVVAPGGKTAKLQCLVKINQNGKQPVAILGDGLRVTLSHPVRIKDEWVYPQQVVTNLDKSPKDELYCFVMNPPLSALINGIECATWGHGLQDDVVKHSYYGTQEVVEDLKMLPGWSSGLVEVQTSVKNHMIKFLKS